MKSALLVATGAAVASASLSDSQSQFLFTRFVDQFEKKYETKDFFSKFGTFKNNLDTIMAHNANPNKTFTMGVNQFADMTTEEFAAYNKLKPVGASLREAAAKPFFNAGLGNNNVDWNAKGVVNPIKNQASCGSCWAFSAISALESIAAMNGAGLNDLSEQQLVDCAGSEGNHGCNGGLMDLAYDYVIKAGGVMLTRDYPYTARDSQCKFDNSKVAQKMSGYSVVAQGASNLEAAAMKQPVAVALAASSSAFQFYTSGVVTTGCGYQLNHAVNVVAMGEEAGLPYYNIRNSWGASWGDKGHIKLARGSNVCGVENHNWNVVPRV